MRIGEAVLTIITTNEIKQWDINTIEGVIVRIKTELAFLQTSYQIRANPFLKFKKAINILENELVDRVLLEEE